MEALALGERASDGGGGRGGRGSGLFAARGCGEPYELTASTLLAAALVRSAIGKKLGISKNTIETH